MNGQIDRAVKGWPARSHLLQSARGRSSTGEHDAGAGQAIMDADGLSAAEHRDARTARQSTESAIEAVKLTRAIADSSPPTKGANHASGWTPATRSHRRIA
jgi:hypothetical protein